MKKKLMIIVPILVLLGRRLRGEDVPHEAEAGAASPKIAGTLVALDDPSSSSTSRGGHYGKVSVALLDDDGAARAAAGTPRRRCPQDAAVRAIITDALTGRRLRRSDRSRRRATPCSSEILRSIKKTTDEPVTNVMFTDLAVQ